MYLSRLTLIGMFVLTNGAIGQQTLPVLHDGINVEGPGRFLQEKELRIEGHVTLKHLTLDLHGPILVAKDATLELEDVHLIVSDPLGAPNGTSGLGCEGPAHVIVRNSTMAPVGSGHPMWRLKGALDVDDFQTENAEFHLDHVRANLKHLKIFELEISNESQVKAAKLDLLFLSTHSSDTDRLVFEGIPTNKPFSRTLTLGSGATAQIEDSTIQSFLLYVHGGTQASLAHLDRVQLAIFPDCAGTLQLGVGRLGGAAQPAVVPVAGTSTCPFRISLNDVNVDTWDVYARGNANLTLQNSVIDELTARDNVKLLIQNSEIYADWMDISGEAQVNVDNSRVGALRLAKIRPDLATSQIRLSGRSHSAFSKVTFDCGIVASDNAEAEINQSLFAPSYINKSGQAIVRQDRGPTTSNSP